MRDTMALLGLVGVFSVGVIATLSMIETGSPYMASSWSFIFGIWMVGIIFRWTDEERGE